METNPANKGETRFHVALGVPDVSRSVAEYTVRLGQAPKVHIPNEYALWRTSQVNFSIRRAEGPAALRHLGIEDDAATSFSEVKDINGIVWERFALADQMAEIHRYWPARMPEKAD